MGDTSLSRIQPGPPKAAFEQEQHYHSFTTWEGEADLQPPINLGWCKIIKPHLLLWFEQDFFSFFLFLKQKHMLIDGTFFFFLQVHVDLNELFM